MNKAQIDRWQTRALMTVCALCLICFVAILFVIPKPAPRPGPVTPDTSTRFVEAKPFAIQADDGRTYAGGWERDEAVLKANLAAVESHFDRTPAGRAVLGDDDVFLWQAVRKVTNRGPPWYPNVDQKDVGCCVGCGWKHSADVLHAIQILRGQFAEWKPVSVEAIYGASRVEIGGGRIRGDGSLGEWAAKAISVYGNLAMEKHGTVDLSVFSPTRAREWGERGIPDQLEPTARQFLVRGVALVKSSADVKRAIQQGYPVAVCSDQGFTMSRDRDGFARASGQWMHCMSIIGYRKTGREGFFILNSWGDNAHTGPVWPADMPVAGFWADAATVDRMVRQGDSFALSDANGFPARQLPDFWIRAGGADQVFVHKE